MLFLHFIAAVDSSCSQSRRFIATTGATQYSSYLILHECPRNVWASQKTFFTTWTVNLAARCSASALLADAVTRAHETELVVTDRWTLDEVDILKLLSTQCTTQCSVTSHNTWWWFTGGTHSCWTSCSTRPAYWRQRHRRMISWRMRTQHTGIDVWRHVKSLNAISCNATKSMHNYHTTYMNWCRTLHWYCTQPKLKLIYFYLYIWSQKQNIRTLTVLNHLTFCKVNKQLLTEIL